MTSDNGDVLMLAACLGLLAVIAFSILGWHHRCIDDWWRAELVRRGHAHYYLDADNNRQWNWLEAKP